MPLIVLMLALFSSCEETNKDSGIQPQSTVTAESTEIDDTGQVEDIQEQEETEETEETRTEALVHKHFCVPLCCNRRFSRDVPWLDERVKD